MRKLLIRIFVTNYENINDSKVRESYGKLAGIVGIASNAFLCIMKISLGLFVNSIAIIADGINNLTDAASSIITFIGFKLSAMPEDEEHPYGHARIEYITGMIVSMLIILLGAKLLMSSIDKVIHPDPLEFNIVIVFVLLLSIGVKVWQSRFNMKIGETIKSTALKATGTDSRNDVIATSAVLLGILIGKATGLQLDGYLGCLVALFIIYSGIQLVRETSGPLLGQAPDPELVKEIQERIQSYGGVLGLHDLAVHNYGPGKIFASVHIEVDAHDDFIASHDLIDNIERELSRQMNLHLVVHMDPVDTKDPTTILLKNRINEIIKPIEGIQGMHDLRIVPGVTHSNIIFDLVLTPNCPLNEKELSDILERKVKEIDESFYLVITFDREYSNYCDAEDLDEKTV